MTTSSSLPSPTLTLRLRPYHPSDLPAISTIDALSNVNDPLNLYQARSIQQHWTSYRACRMRFLRSIVADVGTYCVVCEGVPSGDVVGWAIFTRNGDSEVARGWKRRSRGAGWGMGIERWMLEMEKKYYQHVPGADPTLDRDHARAIQPILRKEWDESVFREYWKLDGLYVHPEQWRRGIGTILINWVLERAGEEGVPVVVRASPMGKPVYEKCGFRVLKRDVAFDRFIEAFRGGGETEGVWKLVWDPPEGNWLERAKRVDERRGREKETK